MLTCGAVAQKTVALVEDMNFEAEEATENKPLRVATSGGHQQPFWTLDKAFAHTSAVDAEVRKGATLVAAQAAQA